MSEIIIRDAREEDAHQIAHLIPQLTLNIVRPADLPERAKLMAKPENFQCFVAEKDGMVIGFAQMGWYRILSKIWRVLVWVDEAWVEEVVVDQNHRGYGVARALLQRIDEFAIEKKFPQVLLMTSNSKAKKLYESMGFVVREDNLMVKKYY